jgi:hypothetical protein
MDRSVFLLSFALAGVVTAGSAVAGQHEGHQAGAAPSAAHVTECRKAQPVITQLLNAALKRLEDARLTNSAAAMRDAADDVQAALGGYADATCALWRDAGGGNRSTHEPHNAGDAGGSRRPTNASVAAGCGRARGFDFGRSCDRGPA